MAKKTRLERYIETAKGALGVDKKELETAANVVQEMWAVSKTKRDKKTFMDLFTALVSAAVTRK